MSNFIDYLKFQTRKNPDHPAVVYLGNAVSYRQLDELVRKIAARLQQEGVRPGHTIAVQIDNTLSHWLFTLALFHEATISCSVPRNSAIPDGVHLDFYITDTPTSICTTPQVRNILVNESWFQALSNENGLNAPQSYESENSICRLILSSGTTGEPKAVPFTYRLLAHRCQNRQMVDPQQGCELSLFDNCNSIGLYSALKSLMTGLPIVMNFSYEQVRNDLQTFHITNLNGSPAQLQHLVDALEQSPLTTRALRTITVSGSAVSSRLIQKLSELACPQITSIYGATEVGPVASCFATDLLNTPKLAGFVFPFVTVEIVDDRDQPLPAGQTGHIRIRTTEMPGHYAGANHAPADSALRNGWFYPGDLGSLQEDGRLIIEGRTSDLLNIGGVKINPHDIDRFLASIDGVLDALSFEYENLTGHLCVGTAIVIREGADIDQIPALISQHLAPMYRPAELFVVKEILRNNAGKPLREQTRALALQHRV